MITYGGSKEEIIKKNFENGDELMCMIAIQIIVEEKSQNYFYTIEWREINKRHNNIKSVDKKADQR